MLKKFLDDHSIPYITKMADEDQDIARELFEKSGQLGVPFSIIEDEEGKTVESVLGFDVAAFNRMIQNGTLVKK